jgi:DNA invertase Pin-like site-specific DNA recombinase
VIEQLQARGAGFRSLGDPIDTSTPQGVFTLQILGAVAELERQLIAARTFFIRASSAKGLPLTMPMAASDPISLRDASLRCSRATKALSLHHVKRMPRLMAWLSVPPPTPPS